MADDLEIEVYVPFFAGKVAKGMDSIKSSQVFFILQQAFPEVADDWEWSDFQKLLTKVIEKAHQEGK